MSQLSVAPFRPDAVAGRQLSAAAKATGAGAGVGPDTLQHRAMLATLPHARYRHGLEIGCGSGALTLQLAPRCGQLLAIDLVQGAISRAEERLRDQQHVRLACRAFPADLQADAPAGGFDLIILSDVLHRLDADGVRQAAAMVRSLAARGGHVQLLSRLDSGRGTRLAGNDAAGLFMASLRAVAPVLLQLRTEDYRIDVLQL